MFQYYQTYFILNFSKPQTRLQEAPCGPSLLYFGETSLRGIWVRCNLEWFFHIFIYGFVWLTCFLWFGFFRRTSTPEYKKYFFNILCVKNSLYILFIIESVRIQ